MRWLAGAAGLTAVGSAAGVSVARSLRRHVSNDDPYEDEDFELLDADRGYVVTTPDGVDLAVREVGPEDARLTVVFAHGFCLRMGAFHFQRARLAEQWGPQVRMVFYDHRGHGQSAEASPDSYTVTHLGTVPEALSHPHRRCGDHCLRGRRGFALAAGGDPQEPGARGGALRRQVRAENGASHPRCRQFGDRPDPAGGVLW